MRRKGRLLWATGGALLGSVIVAGPAAAADDITADVVQTNLDNVFVLLCAVLVIFMQAGFALVEAGLTRAKVFVGVTATGLFLLIKKTIGLRVPEDEELAGLDVAEHGSAGYGEDNGVPSGWTPGTRTRQPTSVG